MICPESAQHHHSRCQTQVARDSRTQKDYNVTGNIKASGSWLVTGMICEIQVVQEPYHCCHLLLPLLAR